VTKGHGIHILWVLKNVWEFALLFLVRRHPNDRSCSSVAHDCNIHGTCQCTSPTEYEHHPMNMPKLQLWKDTCGEVHAISYKNLECLKQYFSKYSYTTIPFFAEDTFVSIKLSSTSIKTVITKA
jgi:hypothetical protein